MDLSKNNISEEKINTTPIEEITSFSLGRHLISFDATDYHRCVWVGSRLVPLLNDGTRFHSLLRASPVLLSAKEIFLISHGSSWIRKVRRRRQINDGRSPDCKFTAKEDHRSIGQCGRPAPEKGSPGEWFYFQVRDASHVKCNFGDATRRGGEKKEMRRRLSGAFSTDNLITTFIERQWSTPHVWYDPYDSTADLKRKLGRHNLPVLLGHTTTFSIHRKPSLQWRQTPSVYRWRDNWLLALLSFFPYDFNLVVIKIFFRIFIDQYLWLILFDPVCNYFAYHIFSLTWNFISIPWSPSFKELGFKIIENVNYFKEAWKIILNLF